MHNLALELASHGHQVTGSDDEIYDPARSRLAEAGLLPPDGWDENRITQDLDLIILGMHAHLDNPELIKAQELGIEMVSFPEYIGRYTSNDMRIVISGSHGKSTTTAMIMHVLQDQNMAADYLLGGMLEGFDRMVRISGAPIMVIEGDEYLSSRIDQRPKMLHYQGDIVVVTGIEWDHMNVFPTLEDYENQFTKLIGQCRDNNGLLIWYERDEALRRIVDDMSLHQKVPKSISYEELSIDKEDNVRMDGETHPIRVFGAHNMANMSAARLVCEQVGIDKESFFKSMASFRGVGKRLQLINETPMVYLDYAHAPSKVRATVAAVRARHKEKRLLAVYELHTYSSLNKSFLPNYRHTMRGADGAVVYFDTHALDMKRMPMLDRVEVRAAFDHPDLMVLTDSDRLSQMLEASATEYDVVLLMSSGTFGGIELSEMWSMIQ